MEFGVSVGHISAVDYAQHGERLGFTRCWVTDSPLIRSNLFATLAAVALQTRTIKIGAGVAVCGMRLAPEAANGVATINALAPGRTFAIFGTGNTAMRMLGLRATVAKALREYVRVVRAMVHGEEVPYSLGDGEAHPVRFTALQQNYIRLDPPPPIYVADNGPLAQAIAGELADGLCTTIPRGGTIPPDVLMPWALQALEGLAAAHKEGFVHRDIKPHNILLHRDRAKISDFGLAKNFQKAGLSGMSMTGSYAGTPVFMPPEQITNFKYVKPVSDVWSFAATLYHLLTGKFPYRFDPKRDPIDIILNEDSVPIQDRMPGLETHIAQVIDKALKKDPINPLQNAMHLLAAVEKSIL